MNQLPDMNVVKTFVMLEVPVGNGQTIVQCQLHNYSAEDLQALALTDKEETVIAAKVFSQKPGFFATAGEPFICDNRDESIDMRTYCATKLKDSFELAMDLTVLADLETVNAMLFTQDDVENFTPPHKVTVPIPDFLRDSLAELIDEFRIELGDAQDEDDEDDGFDPSAIDPNDEDCSVCEREECPAHPSHGAVDDSRKELSELLARLSKKVLEA